MPPSCVRIETIDKKSHIELSFKIKQFLHNFDQKFPIPLMSTDLVCTLAKKSCYTLRKLDLRIYWLHFTPPGDDKSANAVIR
jgi:hypothetical protein